MIVSESTAMIVGAVLGVAGILPVIVAKFTHKNILRLSLVLLVPVIYGIVAMPTIVTVTECGKYSKELLFLPEGEYTLGDHSYIKNSTDKPLFLEYLVYAAKGSEPKNVPQDFIIPPGKTVTTDGSKVDYLFTKPPSIIQTKSNSSVRSHLSCEEPEGFNGGDVSDEEEEEEGEAETQEK